MLSEILYLILLITSIIVPMVLIVFSPHRTRWLPSFAWLIGSVMVFNIAVLLSAISPSADFALFAAKLRFVGASAAIPLALLVILEYTQNSLARDWRLVAGIIGSWLLTFVIALTNESHGWFATTWSVERGELLWLEVAQFNFAGYYGFCLLLTVLAIALVVASFASSWRFLGRIARRQALLLTAGGAVALIGSYISTFVTEPLLRFNLAPIFYTVGLSVITLALLRYRMFDLPLIAQPVLFGQMRDGVILLDEWDRWIEANPSAQQMLSLPRQPDVGESFVTLSAHPLVDQLIGLLSNKTTETTRCDISISTTLSPTITRSISLGSTRRIVISSGG